MKIDVINNVPNVKVIVNESEKGFTILLSEETKQKLGDVAPGTTIKLGNREYVVLDHGKDITAVITKDFAKSMEFGENNDYRFSDVRKYCNDEFYKELVETVGKENIVKHKVNLMADDGTGAGKETLYKDNVSILTTELYRKYRDFLPAYGDWWWTATPINSDNENYACYVCYVDSDGVLGQDYCGCSRGVRPFCILNSSVQVDV